MLKIKIPPPPPTPPKSKKLTNLKKQVRLQKFKRLLEELEFEISRQPNIQE